MVNAVEYVAHPVRRNSYRVYLILLAGYFIMFMLISEQNRTIEGQRMLIRALFHDSKELSDLRGREIVRLHQTPDKK